MIYLIGVTNLKLFATHLCDRVATRFFLVDCLLNISDILIQAMNALQVMDSYWKEVVCEYMKE